MDSQQQPSPAAAGEADIMRAITATNWAAFPDAEVLSSVQTTRLWWWAPLVHAYALPPSALPQEYVGPNAFFGCKLCLPNEAAWPIDASAFEQVIDHALKEHGLILRYIPHPQSPPSSSPRATTNPLASLFESLSLRRQKEKPRFDPLITDILYKMSRSHPLSNYRVEDVLVNEEEWWSCLVYFNLGAGQNVLSCRLCNESNPKPGTRLWRFDGDPRSMPTAVISHIESDHNIKVVQIDVDPRFRSLGPNDGRVTPSGRLTPSGRSTPVNLGPRSTSFDRARFAASSATATYPPAASSPLATAAYTNSYYNAPLPAIPTADIFDQNEQQQLQQPQQITRTYSAGPRPSTATPSVRPSTVPSPPESPYQSSRAVQSSQLASFGTPSPFGMASTGPPAVIAPNQASIADTLALEWFRLTMNQLLARHGGQVIYSQPESLRRAFVASAATAGGFPVLHEAVARGVTGRQDGGNDGGVLRFVDEAADPDLAQLLRFLGECADAGLAASVAVLVLNWVNERARPVRFEVAFGAGGSGGAPSVSGPVVDPLPSGGKEVRLDRMIETLKAAAVAKGVAPSVAGGDGPGFMPGYGTGGRGGAAAPVEPARGRAGEEWNY